MSNAIQNNKEAQMLKDVQGKSWPARFRTYLNLSGPGWLQSALTLGAGSMASSLYLGVLTGYSMLWLQPVAMILGIIMIAALGYMTLFINEKPFRAINRHINPVLGWGWILGSLLASVVWAFPQFSLAIGVIQQNLMPGTFGAEGTIGGMTGLTIISVIILAVSYFITWNYDKGNKGVRIYELILKGIVGIIILSFIGVVLRITLISDSIDWGQIWSGLIPNPALIFRPAKGFAPLLAGLSETSRQFWTDLIVTRQQNVMAAALSSAVGINMTFLFAYSILRRQWGPEYKGLMKFDLATGMFIPFALVVSCVVISSASQFHAIPQPGFKEGQTTTWKPTEKQITQYNQMLESRVAYEYGKDNLSQQEVAEHINELNENDRTMAATLVTRDAFDLANSLKPLLGSVFGQVIFGIGVLGMTLSSITLMMMISGLVLCEALNKPHTGRVFRLGALIPGIAALGPFFWDKASFWLAIPTSIITLMLLPIAYITFLLMMNNKSLMGKHMPRGKKRVIWNTLMIVAVILITSASLYMLWTRGGLVALVMISLFLAGIGIAAWNKRKKKNEVTPQTAQPENI